MASITHSFNFVLPPVYVKLVERGCTTRGMSSFFRADDAEWLTLKQTATHRWPVAGVDRALTPFDKTLRGDHWCWCSSRPTSGGEYDIAFCPHDSIEGQWFAPTLMGWIFRLALEFSMTERAPVEEMKETLAKWTTVVEEFGNLQWAQTLRDIAARPLQSRRHPRSPKVEMRFLLAPEEYPLIIRSLLGEGYVNQKFRWIPED